MFKTLWQVIVARRPVQITVPGYYELVHVGDFFTNRKEAEKLANNYRDEQTLVRVRRVEVAR